MRSYPRKKIVLLMGILVLSACSPVQPSPTPAVALPNPASVFCQEQGFELRISTAEDGSQSGECVFPDGSACDEWAFYRGECAPTTSPEKDSQDAATAGFPTPLPIQAEDYAGWWTYTHPELGFSIRLPEDWQVEQVTSFDPLMNGHLLTLKPDYGAEESIRMSFRRSGEEALLFPTGVGSGEFVPQGTLLVSGMPVRRTLFVCPTGEVSTIWYQGDVDQSEIRLGNLEFGFIFGYPYCLAGASLGGKVQLVGEMIIASLQVP